MPLERERLGLTIVLEDGRDTEVLGRLAHADVAAAKYDDAVSDIPMLEVYHALGSAGGEYTAWAGAGDRQRAHRPLSAPSGKDDSLGLYNGNAIGARNTHPAR